MPSARVLEVIDGKTILISPKWEHEEFSGFIIVLDGVEAPARDEKGGIDAKSAHEKICIGKNINYEGNKVDPHRRLISEVDINGVSVNETLRELGYRS